MTSRTANLVNIIDRTKKDTDESIQALRLQAKAWRIVALIATHDRAKGVDLAGWMFFHTVPFVDGVAVESFIEEYMKEAEECGKKSGVFGESGVSP